MLGGNDGLASLEVRILEHVGRTIDQPRRHSVLVHRVEYFRGGQRLGPGLDQPVEQALVGAAGLMIDEARVFRPFPLFHRLAQATEDGVLVGGDQHEAIERLVDIRRCDVRQDRAGALTDEAGLVVLGDQRFHHRQHRFIKR